MQVKLDSRLRGNDKKRIASGTFPTPHFNSESSFKSYKILILFELNAIKQIKGHQSLGIHYSISY